MRFKNIEEYIEYAGAATSIDSCCILTDRENLGEAFPSDLMAFLSKAIPAGFKLEMSRDLNNSPSAVILQNSFSERFHMSVDSVIKRILIKVMYE